MNGKKGNEVGKWGNKKRRGGNFGQMNPLPLRRGEKRVEGERFLLILGCCCNSKGHRGLESGPNFWTIQQEVGKWGRVASLAPKGFLYFL